MYKFFTSFAFCLLTLLFACEDKNEINNPAWVENWIGEIESDQYCTSCEIHRYQFEREHYYELYSPVFSCRPCQVHDASGTAVDSIFHVQDYIDKRKGKTLVYRKNNK